MRLCVMAPFARWPLRSPRCDVRRDGYIAMGIYYTGKVNKRRAIILIPYSCSSAVWAAGVSTNWMWQPTRRVWPTVSVLCGEGGLCACLVSVHAQFSICLLQLLQIIPEFSTPLMQGTAIFIQSYFDFVRIRNYLKKEEISFCQICELVWCLFLLA